MSIESKVGAFVLAGLMLLGAGIFLLGNFSLEKRYVLHATFDDVTGLAEDSPVRLAGVDVGKVRHIEFKDNKIWVDFRVRDGIVVHQGAAAMVGSTGIIGSKFLQITQGDMAAPALPPDSVLPGKEEVSIEKALTSAFNSLQDLLEGLNGNEKKQGPLTKNLNATIVNVRELTANLNEMMGDIKPSVTKTMDRMDVITAKLDAILTKTDQMMTAINEQKGPVGALLHDEKMKEDVKQTVSSLKDVAGTAKDVLGRINQFRVYWNYDWRYENAIRGGHGDIGLKISPREGRYYYVGGANLGNPSDIPHRTDYEKKNTVDGLLGFEWRGWDAGVGVIRSAGGGRLTWTPVPDDPVWGRLSLMAQAYDFSRNRVMSGRQFTHPEYDFGGMVRLHRLVGVGAQVDDVQEVKRYQTWVNVNFEDKDIAYLFGMVTFGAAGTKGRSKSSSH